MPLKKMWVSNTLLSTAQAIIYILGVWIGGHITAAFLVFILTIVVKIIANGRNLGEEIEDVCTVAVLSSICAILVIAAWFGTSPEWLAVLLAIVLVVISIIVTNIVAMDTIDRYADNGRRRIIALPFFLGTIAGIILAAKYLLRKALRTATS